MPEQTNPPRIDYPNDPNGDPTKPGVPTEDIVTLMFQVTFQEIKMETVETS